MIFDPTLFGWMDVYVMLKLRLLIFALQNCYNLTMLYNKVGMFERGRKNEDYISNTIKVYK